MNPYLFWLKSFKPYSFFKSRSLLYRYIHEDSPNRAMWWPLTTPIASTSSASTIGSECSRGNDVELSGGAYTITYHNHTWGGIGSRYTNINIYIYTTYKTYTYMYVYKIVSFKSYSELWTIHFWRYCSFQFWSNIQCSRWCIPGRARPPALHIFLDGSVNQGAMTTLDLLCWNYLARLVYHPKFGGPLWIPWIMWSQHIESWNPQERH